MKLSAVEFAAYAKLPAPFVNVRALTAAQVDLELDDRLVVTVRHGGAVIALIGPALWTVAIPMPVSPAPEVEHDQARTAPPAKGGRRTGPPHK